MKKLLIFMLVLGLASVSQATVELVVNAGTPVPTMGTGDTIQIDLVADFVCIGFEMGLVTTTDGSGTVDGVIEDPAVSSPVSWGYFDGGYIINGAYSQPGVLFDCVSASTGSQSAGNIIASFDYVIPGGWSAAFTIGFAAEGTEYLDSWETPCEAGPSYASSAGGSFSIDPLTIPEPMTIALLGLGGLFLRRRR